ncbi:MAG: pyrophosphokinae [Solirubrobacteraceae bacterium]|jgi:ppGpp synthetase/RelA/SpoT-type nucleotidyltranferase|nr:pyrophosphokinae [Solirubrobacteraceae bacterium]
MALDRREVEAAFRDRAQRYNRANERITELLNALLDDLSAGYGVREGLVVSGKPKNFDSFFRKATEKYECRTTQEAFKRVRDLSRVRVECHTLDDCYRLMELLRNASNVIFVDEATVEDYIASPSTTGYRAIHLEVVVDVPVDMEFVGVPVEIQIRSALQEAWGHYTHDDFYHAEHTPELVAQLMRELSDLLYWADRHAATLVEQIARAKRAAEPDCPPPAG